MVQRLNELHPATVAFFVAVAVAIEATGVSAIHPTLGRLWDAIATVGAAAVASIPFVTSTRIRGVLTSVAAFVIISHAAEWVRLTEASPVGISVAALWAAALFAIVLQVSADEVLRRADDDDDAV